MDDLVSMAREIADRMVLIDNHCHSVDLSTMDRYQFEDHLTEAPDRASAVTSTFDSMAGLMLLRDCGSLIGALNPSPDSYIRSRNEIPPDELAKLFFSKTGVDTLMVDTGYNADSLASNQVLEELSGAAVLPILRLETFAESVISALEKPEDFADSFRAQLKEGGQAYFGLKSIAAYRCGLELRSNKVERQELLTEVSQVMSSQALGQRPRVASETIVSFVLQSALEMTELPIQFHIGYGDPDLQLDRANPALLTPFIRMAASRGRSIVLLHCYPFHREAAYLAHSFPNVFFDLGLAMNFVGPYAPRILSEAMELAPFSKLLYSSDAFALSELHYLGSVTFRRAVAELFGYLATSELATKDYLSQLARMFSRENTQRAYRI